MLLTLSSMLSQGFQIEHTLLQMTPEAGYLLPVVLLVSVVLEAVVVDQVEEEHAAGRQLELSNIRKCFIKFEEGHNTPGEEE